MINNTSTAKATLRDNEKVDVLILQILGLIERKGQGQFVLTEKFERLSTACARKISGETLLNEEDGLLRECAILITRH